LRTSGCGRLSSDHHRVAAIPKDLGLGRRAASSCHSRLLCCLQLAAFVRRLRPCLYALIRCEHCRALEFRQAKRSFRSCTRHPRSSNGSPPHDQLLAAIFTPLRARTLARTFPSKTMQIYRLLSINSLPERLLYLAPSGRCSRSCIGSSTMKGANRRRKTMR